MSFPYDLHSAAVSDSHLLCYAMPMPCSDHAVLLKATAQHGRLRRPCCAVALRRTAWSEHGMASVNQTRQHCVNQMGKAHSKPLAARHGRGAAWARHAMCEWALSVHCTYAFTVCETQSFGHTVIYAKLLLANDAFCIFECNTFSVRIKSIG